MSVPARSYAAAVAAGHLTLEEVRAEMEASDEHREMLAAQRRREKTRMHIVETETEPPFHIVVVSAPNAVARVWRRGLGPAFSRCRPAHISAGP